MQQPDHSDPVRQRQLEKCLLVLRKTQGWDLNISIMYLKRERSMIPEVKLENINKCYVLYTLHVKYTMNFLKCKYSEM